MSFNSYLLNRTLGIVLCLLVMAQPHQGPGAADQAARSGAVAPPGPSPIFAAVSVIVAS
jgi:hypothetical protein